MNLQESLKKFAHSFGRKGRDIGNIILQDNNDFVDTDNLDAFYQILKFDKILTVGGELFINIYPLINLDRSQEGWYKIKNNNLWIEDNVKWNKDWVVFANRNDDAIYFNLKDNAIYGSINKHQTYKLSNSLSVFFQVLSEAMVLEDQKYDFETFDEDEETIPAFLDDIYAIVLKYNDEEASNGFMSFFFE